MTIGLEKLALRKERRRAEQLGIVNEIGRHIAAILNVDQLLQRIAHLIKDAFKQYDVNILLLDAKTGELTWQAGTRFGDSSAIPTPFLRLPPGAGITGWVVQHGQPLLVNDVLQEPRYLSVPELPDTRSELAVPITRGGHILGVLDVQDAHPGAYDEDDISILETLASQIVVALDNARLFEQTQQRVSELMALRQVSLRLISTVDLSEVLETIAESALRLIGASDVHIYLYDDQTKTFTFGTALWDTGSRQPAVSAPWTNGLTALVASEARPIVINDTTHHSLFQGPEVQNWRLPGIKRPQAIAGFPLIQGNRVLGVFNVAFLNPHTFTEDELRTLNLLADHAALGIQRARLFEELNHRLNQLSTLYHMAQQTTSSLALDQVLEAIVAQLRTVISCRAICIFLPDKSMQELRIAAATGLKPEFRERTRPKIGEGVSGLVFQQVRPIYVKNIPEEAPDLHTDPSIRSLLVVPLIAKSKVIGTLSVDSTAVDAFTPGDERLLTIVAAQAASAIENAQLFEAEKERAEELKRAYEELKELDRLKSQFVQNVSHELRTPLTFIKGYIDLLTEEALGSLNQRQKQSLDIVVRKTDAITRLVNDIITLQEIEALPMIKSLIPLKEMLTMVAATAQAAAMNAHIELRVEIPEQEMWILADTDRLTQVFDNLIGNAIKFSPDGGSITISAQDGGDCWLVAVRDTGIGIPADRLEKIFERFYQVDGSTTRRFGGTGLGLAIAREIVTAHNGKIWAESILGKGSTFFVSLPKCSAPESDDVKGA